MQTEESSVPLEAWQRVLHFKLVPVLKVVKHSLHPESPNQTMQAEIERLEARNQQLAITVACLEKERVTETNGSFEASALREQLSASEQQVTY